MYIHTGTHTNIRFDLTHFLDNEKDDIGEEPPKSDTEDNPDDRVKEKGRRRRGPTQGNDVEEEDDDEEEADGDEENEFQGNEDDDDDNGDEDMGDEEDEADEEMNANAPGSPASSSNPKNKRQRSNTPPVPNANNATSSSSFDVKMQLTTNLLYLNGTDLGHVMSLLEQHCPKVLESYSNNDSNNKSGNDNRFPIPECLEINVDLLMDEYYNIFTMIQQYCNDHVVKKRLAASGGSALKIKDISNRRKDRKT
jgi:hypothetical protein